MLKREDRLHPLGICHKVFNFISRLFSPGLKVSIGVPVDVNGEEMLQHQEHERSTAVEIHFKLTEEDLDSWTPIDNLRSAVHLHSDQPQFKKHDTLSSSSSSISAEATKNKELPLVQVNGTSLPQIRRRAKPTNQETPKMIQEQGTQKAVSTKESTENEEKKIASENIRVPIDSKDPKVRYPPHLLSVTPNINEKSESFLKSRIEAMRNSHGLELEES